MIKGKYNLRIYEAQNEMGRLIEVTERPSSSNLDVAIVDVAIVVSL